MKAPNITASSATATFSARRLSQCATAMRRTCIGALSARTCQVRLCGAAAGWRVPAGPHREMRRALLDGVDRIERVLRPVLAVAVGVLLLRERAEGGHVRRVDLLAFLLEVLECLGLLRVEPLDVFRRDIVRCGLEFGLLVRAHGVPD